MGKHGPFDAHNDYDDDDEADAVQKQKARALKEQQTTTSTVEQHYYHMHEVWHCLYNRMETHHLRDPDNQEFKSEDARKRQILLFESLMQTSQGELYRAVNADIDNECCARLQPMEKASIGSIKLVHAEAAKIIQRHTRKHMQMKAKRGGGSNRGAKMHTQAQQSMAAGAYEDAAKHMFSAYSFVTEAKDKECATLERQVKRLEKQVDELQAKLNKQTPEVSTQLKGSSGDVGSSNPKFGAKLRNATKNRG